MTDIRIPDAEGRLLNARVEIDDGQIVVHSRSGDGVAGRNPDYRPALEIILTRLQAEGIKPDVFLDSAPSRSRPLAERHRAGPSALAGEVAEQFNFIVRRSNAGSASHGAWRRLLLLVPALPEYALKSILDGSAQSRRTGMTQAQLERVERRHIEAAVEELQGGTERPNRFEEATGYLLIPPNGGAPLPPKKVFGIALAEALHTHTTPQDFSSGEQIFAIMRQRGFEIVPFAEAPRRLDVDSNNPELEGTTSDIPLTEEERSWIEGNIAVATHLRRERSGSLPRQFKADFRQRHGRLFCEGCSRDHIAEYGLEVAEACFEVHHKVPVAQMTPGYETRAIDLVLLKAQLLAGVEHAVREFVFSDRLALLGRDVRPYRKHEDHFTHEAGSLIPAQKQLHH